MLQRIIAPFTVSNTVLFKKQMLNWANRFSICCFMDSNDYPDKYQKFDCIVAVDPYEVFDAKNNIFPRLEYFCNQPEDWIFGHLGYDLKNEIEELTSAHQNNIDFPDIFLFKPNVVLCLKNEQLTIHSIKKDPQQIFDEITNETAFNSSTATENILLNTALSKNEYLSAVKKLQQHILRGDCYEINYCQEFFAEHVVIDPLTIYTKLQRSSPTPFSCFYKLDKKHLLCASPERFLTKNGNTILSQPIKGTAPRNADAILDTIGKNNLYQDQKEKSENVMIVDLVRNDLSKICREGTVEAEELFGIYSFPQVHQMISTIKGELKPDISFAEIIKSTFPMGSMTGAPKHNAMLLIDAYEKTKRGLFSGSVGYITPGKDFDFNVVIRSIFYNATNKFLNLLAGSAITFYADAEKEYEECLLKVKAMREILE